MRRRRRGRGDACGMAPRCAGCRDSAAAWHHRGVIVLFALLGIVVIAMLAVLLARPRPLLPEDQVELRRVALPDPADLRPQDLANARFSLALRGYRMSEVDQLLRVAELALAQARASSPASGSVTGPDGGQPEPAEDWAVGGGDPEFVGMPKAGDVQAAEAAEGVEGAAVRGTEAPLSTPVAGAPPGSGDPVPGPERAGTASSRTAEEGARPGSDPA